MTLSKQLISYIKDLTLYGGDCDGQKFTVLPWEKQFLKGAFPKGGPINSYLTVARGNGKSALVAAIATAMIDPRGPLHLNRAQCICVASSFEQGKIIYTDVLSFLREMYDLTDRSEWIVNNSDHSAKIEHKASGAVLRCIGSDPQRAHGLRPKLVLMDEPAQWPKNSAQKMFSALSTSLGKVPESRMIVLGTQSEDPMHFFSQGIRNEGGDCYVQKHVASVDDGKAMFTIANYREANPSWDQLPSLRDVIKKEAKKARKDPLSLPPFKALRLNHGVHDTEQHFLIDPVLWRECLVNKDELPPREGPMMWGIDLGESFSQSVGAAYWPYTYRLECLAAFPHVPSLEQRGINEGMGDIWVQMAQLGDLIQCGFKAIDQTELIRAAAEKFGYHPEVIGNDRWKQKPLYNVINTVGISCMLQDRGMGFKDGGEDVRNFRKLVASGRVKCGKSLLLHHSVMSARVTVDPAGNAKIDKTAFGKVWNARDDAAVAACIAVSLGEIYYPEAREGKELETMNYLEMAI